jgi:hypothetical protein
MSVPMSENPDPSTSLRAGYGAPSCTQHAGTLPLVAREAFLFSERRAGGLSKLSERVEGVAPVNAAVGKGDDH